MKKRYTVLALSVVLALALAVPALGGPTNPVASISASVKSIANKALKKAKAAQSTANSALSLATAAENDATAAGKEASNASKAAKTAQTTANEAKTSAANAQTTANEAKASAANALTVANSKLQATEFFGGSFTPSNGTTFKIAASECPAGQVVTGGGFEVGGAPNEVTVGSEQSAFYGPGWLVTANAIAGKTPTWSLRAIAVCAHT
ncbi:MAG TPA: hypothetical protein VHI77_03225 [Solirubrobacterales bacterium]|jgi:hypothetical protein|nr:hypothetical protein [Solirubrobacterales bacterium]